MRTTPNEITSLVLKRLAASEVRLLTLTVAVRSGLVEQGGYRGDLGRAIQLVLRDLVKTKRVSDADGAYSLTHSTRAAVAQGFK